MIFRIDAHSGVPIYRQIMDQVREAIMTGQLVEGDQLEHVRSLASRLKINPMTVSKAYGYLKQEGLVEQRLGVGLFVAKIRKSDKQRMKMIMLEKEIQKSVSMAIRMEVSEKEVNDLFKKYYRKFRSGRTIHEQE